MSVIKIEKEGRIRECMADDFEHFEAQGYKKVGAPKPAKKPASKKPAKKAEAPEVSED